jgi:hypothetical protein
MPFAVMPQIRSRYRTKRWQKERQGLEEENWGDHGLRMGKEDTEVDN